MDDLQNFIESAYEMLPEGAKPLFQSMAVFALCLSVVNLKNKTAQQINHRAQDAYHQAIETCHGESGCKDKVAKDWDKKENSPYKDFVFTP